MTYAQYGTVAAADFNTLVTGYANGAPNPAAAALNSFWSTGNQNKGYGQTATAAATAGDTIAVGKWANLVANTSSAATHQGSSITAVAVPVAGGTITYLSAIPSNLTTVYNNRLNAATQGTTSSISASRATTWLNAITFTHTVTFPSGDAARYFFNAGGQLAITCSHPTGSGIDLLLNNLASNVGTVVMSSPNSGAVTVSGTSYNGITRVGGGGNTPTIGTNNGYFAMTTTNVTAYNQTASTGPSGYLSTYINMQVKSNGPQGANGDTGSVITITTLWDEIPNGLVAAAGSTVTLTVRRPESTNIANTWGAFSIAGSVAGS